MNYVKRKIDAGKIETFENVWKKACKVWELQVLCDMFENLCYSPCYFVYALEDVVAAGKFFLKMENVDK